MGEGVAGGGTAMTTTRKVTLVGGPKNGETISVDDNRRVVTVSWTDMFCKRNWGDDLKPHWVTVAVTEIATYRATDDPFVFEHIPDPTAIGDIERIMEGDWDV